ncbi:MAG: anti-sigma factor family protein [Thermoguttaceae bacterium]
MRPVRPEEVSALLDGELPPERANEVRLAIANDDHLRQVYQELAETDGRLASLAAACRFEPRISLPPVLEPPVLGLPIWAVATGLLIVRIVAKLAPAGPGLILQAAVIALLAGWLLWRLLPALRADRGLVARELGQTPPDEAWTPATV